MTAVRRAGFIGLGAMGEPMARNILKAGIPLLVWNRSPGRRDLLAADGAEVAASAADLIARSDIVLTMLTDGPAIDAALGRHEPGFAARLGGRTVVNMATVAPAWSAALEADLAAAGAAYVEAPVSGSRKPAEAGQLVVMLAGAPDAVARVRPLMAPLAREIVPCGAVPQALAMKLAVNIFLISMVTGLAEAFHFAQRSGLDLARFAGVLDAGPMASEVSRVKLGKLLAGDLAVQASIPNVAESARLIVEAAASEGIAAPLIGLCHELYRETLDLGHADADMAAVVKAFESRTAARA